MPRAGWRANTGIQKNETRLLPDGGWELAIPYSDSWELLMDILKYGPEAEVISPAELRREVKKRLSAALNRYKSG